MPRSRPVDTPWHPTDTRKRREWSRGRRSPRDGGSGLSLAVVPCRFLPIREPAAVLTILALLEGARTDDAWVLRSPKGKGQAIRRLPPLAQIARPLKRRPRLRLPYTTRAL